MTIDIDQQSSSELQCSKAERLTEDIVTDISKDQRELLTFAYEMLKTDVDQKFTFDLLNGQVKPHSLVQVIMSNKWNPKLDKM